MNSPRTTHLSRRRMSSKPASPLTDAILLIKFTKRLKAAILRSRVINESAIEIKEESHTADQNLKLRRLFVRSLYLRSVSLLSVRCRCSFEPGFFSLPTADTRVAWSLAQHPQRGLHLQLLR
jgi:hypothetical protein